MSEKEEKIKELIKQIDLLQVDLEESGNPIIASILSQKYHELEKLGVNYSPF